MSVYVNGRDLAALVYGILDLQGHLGAVLPQRETVPLANGPGVYGTTVTVAPREVTVMLDVRPTLVADRVTSLDTVRRRLGGLLELTTADLPGRVLRCELRDLGVQFYSAPLAIPHIAVTLKFVAVDPARWDVQPLTYGLSTTRVACPLGTDTSAPDLELYGTCTNPTVILRAHTGAEVARLEFSAGLAANDALVISCSQQTITRYSSGVVQTGSLSGLSALTGGRFFVLSPEDASPLGTVWPTIELTAASGTPIGLVTYTRRY